MRDLPEGPSKRIRLNSFFPSRPTPIRAISHAKGGSRRPSPMAGRPACSTDDARTDAAAWGARRGGAVPGAFSTRRAHELAGQARSALTPSFWPAAPPAPEGGLPGCRSAHVVAARPLPPRARAHCPARAYAHTIHALYPRGRRQGPAAVSILAGAALGRLPAFGSRPSRRVPVAAPRRRCRIRPFTDDRAAARLACLRKLLDSNSSSQGRFWVVAETCVQGRTRPAGPAM